jgi:hypothetical protein
VIQSTLARVDDAVVILGDSIVEASTLPRSLCGHPIVNAGVGGASTASNLGSMLLEALGNAILPALAEETRAVFIPLPAMPEQYPGWHPSECGKRPSYGASNLHFANLPKRITNSLSDAVNKCSVLQGDSIAQKH